MVAELCERLPHESSEKNKYRSLLRELLDAQRNRKSEQLSKEQLALFETLWKDGDPEAAEEDADSEPEAEQEQDAPEEPPQAKKRSGGQPLAEHVIRERIVHDLPEAEKHCGCCGKDLRLFDEEISERYEYIPASIKVIEDVLRKVRLRLHDKDGRQARTANREEHGGREHVGARDRQLVRRPSATAPPGEDV